jgi:hypothetical protein
MDMNVNIYLPDELGERVKKAGLEVSRVCQGALAREVENAEAEEKATAGMKFGSIKVGVTDTKGGSLTKAFVGCWLVEDMASEEDAETAGFDGRAFNGSWSIALTKRGNFAIYCDLGTDGSTFKTYGSLDEAENDGVPPDVVAAASQEMGVHRVIELDI